jgi:pimeloyl-ACP methyl ester carboxylesterase
VPHADLHGLQLYYERTGSGAPALLFSPGWCCDHTAFQPQVDHFRRTRRSVPTLLLRADLSTPANTHRLREIKPDLEVGITVGAGHFHQLEVPEQVNAMIERFLALSLSPADA